MSTTRVAFLALTAALALSTSAEAAPRPATPATTHKGASKLSIGEGFVDGGRLVVAVETGTLSDDRGAVMSIDRTSGARSVLSGKVDDPNKGPMLVGNGPDLGGIRAVTRAGTSWLALVAQGAGAPISIIRIDPTTGVRTLERKIEGPLSCAGSKSKLVIDVAGGIAGGPDGTAYLAVGSGPRASVVAVKGFTCTVVARSRARGADSMDSGVTWSARVWQPPPDMLAARGG